MTTRPRLLPAVEAIQALEDNRVGQEESWREIMKKIAEVKAEYGADGLGLTHVYQVAMKAVADEQQPEAALQLFYEVLETMN